ncbi:hypothetical protein [Bartonella harrusi]|uniref:Transcriptional regulator n=1 Tax=Bartonella harrusi TaxID=2961895 RepID=A0ABY5EUY2_9HYPH|nr:hypothetical protein [Bartonella harrusi]UTO29221.1 hypothetical protein NMK50_04640 [Bartonella harrusi]
MIKTYTETAKFIIAYLGGYQKVANIINRNVIVVRKWAYPLEKREGKGGIIPAKYQVILLNYADQHNIDLRPEDFFYPERLQNLLEVEKLSSTPAFVDDLSVRVKSPKQRSTSHQPNSHS